jgi:hypothetical protein
VRGEMRKIRRNRCCCCQGGRWSRRRERYGGAGAGGCAASSRRRVLERQAFFADPRVCYPSRRASKSGGASSPLSFAHGCRQN